ncbi:CDP-diacylglycerol--glycerol-3-phosphate 3-phosphatidyltransferase [Persephonella hydrogeniphila]|uniref:CDP-diacylglycerol--glycerol-3-phosphate 3-phosphatidyltransferase n=1 Tax=Persephonella hydrogeniphila TaxID=198703 RepID=A0A285NC47_9AQUI|nr:CDP-alcohol phosphatidyltransferase family protein [Persephonella hydrogeniphila]SNZ07072.1 CDP-diacylglycerol--glycerol-3-phosphate 3-phosphatidyltransferase [Persephonella hydrogeniphila]
MSQIIKQLKPVFEELFSPVVSFLNKIGITPNFLTFSGIIFVLASSYFIYTGEFLTGGILLLIGNLCDALDGTLARKFNKESKFGAFLDSVIDRFSDFLPVIAIGLYLKEDDTVLLLSIFAVLFSFMVSYTRARAEGLGIDCKVGIMERAERSVVLILSLIFDFIVAGLLIIAIGALITTLQRIVCVYKKSD